MKGTSECEEHWLFSLVPNQVLFLERACGLLTAGRAWFAKPESDRCLRADCWCPVLFLLSYPRVRVCVTLLILFRNDEGRPGGAALESSTFHLLRVRRDVSVIRHSMDSHSTDRALAFKNFFFAS